MKGFMLAIPVGLIAASARGYVWTGGATPSQLGDGDVSLSYEGQAVREFAVRGSWDASGVLTGDPIGFSDGGCVKMCADGAFKFENQVASAGDMAVESALPPRISYLGVPLAKTEGTAQVLFANRNLTDYEFESSNWGAQDLYPFWNSGMSYPYFQNRTATTLSCQFQQWDGKNTRWMFVTLFQDGPDIRGYITDARYRANNDLGTDGSNIGTRQTIATATVGGYGVDQMTLRRVGGETSVVTFASALTVPKTLAVSPGVKVIAEGDAAVPTVAVDGEFSVRGGTSDLTAVVSGSGDFRVENGSRTLMLAVSGSGRVLVDRTADDAEAGSVRSVTLQGENKSSGLLELAGAEDRVLQVSVPDVVSFPKSGAVHVWENAELWMTTAGSNGGSDARADSTVTVHTGGALVKKANWCLGRDHAIVLDGGRLSLDNTGLYCNRMTFRNGGFIENVNPSGDAYPRICYNGDAVWTVDGTSASSCAVGAQVVGDSNESHDDYIFTLDVADATGDASVDFALGPVIRFTQSKTYPGKNNNVRIVKKGGGTLEFTGANTFLGPLVLEDGLLLLGATQSIDKSHSLTLAGGSLASSAGSANVIKSLTVSANASIRLADGSSLTVKAIGSWAADAVVTIDAPLDRNCLRFGESSDALTADQLVRMRTVRGHAVELDKDGWLRDICPGLVIQIK